MRKVIGPVTAVICLMDTDEYKVLDDDDWQDYRLKLAVHEDEEDGWLILGIRERQGMQGFHGRTAAAGTWQRV